jgi:hypothetical protein
MAERHSGNGIAQSSYDPEWPHTLKEPEQS